MHRQAIESESVPRFRVDGKPVDYSNVVEVKAAGRLLFFSGQNAFDANGDVVGVGDIDAQARQALDNLKSLVGEAGATMDDIVKLTCWITKREYVSAYVNARNQYFSKAFPASSTVVCDLVQDDLLIEIEAVAALE